MQSANLHFLTLSCLTFVDSIYKYHIEILYFSSTVCIIGAICIVSNRRRYTSFNPKLLLAVVPLLYFLLRSAGDNSVDALKVMSCICLLFIIAINDITIPDMALSGICFCIIQYVLCVLQATLQIGIQNRFFIFTGMFDNPNALALSFCVFLPFFIDQTFKHPKIRGLLIFIIIGNLILMSVTKCRIGLTLYILYIAAYFIKKRGKYSHRDRAVLITLLLTGIIFFCVFFEGESNRGRWLILKVSHNIPLTNHIFGDGEYAFRKNYMICQALFFENTPFCGYEDYADNTSHPLNEFVSIYFNYGITGSLFVMLLIISLTFNRNGVNRCFVDSALIIFAYSLFFYTFRYQLICCLMTLNVVCAFKSIGHNVNIANKILLPINCLFLIILSIYSLRVLSFQTKWDKANNMVCSGVNCDLEYSELHTIFNTPYFLYNYAFVLNEQLEHEKSNLILDEYDNFIIDYPSMILRANNYFSRKEYHKALTSFNTAHNMCPNKFRPLSGMLKCYINIGNHDKALELAKEIKNKIPKINSYTVEIIKQYAEAYLKQNEYDRKD